LRFLTIGVHLVDGGRSLHPVESWVLGLMIKGSCDGGRKARKDDEGDEPCNAALFVSRAFRLERN
jgi:hypothetical protein